MSDAEAHLAERLAKCQGELVPHIDLAAATYDFQVVLAVLLSRAGALAQAALSAGVFTPSQATAYFSAALEGSLEPRESKVTVMYADGDTPIGRKQ